MDYGKGAVLGAATTLPATSTAGYFLLNGSHPVIVIGMIAVGAVSLVITTAYMTRFLVNRKG